MVIEVHKYGYTIAYEGPGEERFAEYLDKAFFFLRRAGLPCMINRATSIAVAMMVRDGIITVYEVERKIKISRNGRELSGKSMRTQIYRWFPLLDKYNY